MLKTILLVEDSEDDCFFFEQARIAAGIHNPVQCLEDGQQALDYLSGRAQYADRKKHPLPFLVILDLKLPHVPGLEVLQWIKEHPEFEKMLVVILTSSREERDIDAAYRLGANSFLVKPPSPEQLTELVKLLGDYWCRRNEPPRFAVAGA